MSARTAAETTASDKYDFKLAAPRKSTLRRSTDEGTVCRWHHAYR
jgi:hypothetical protein